MYAGSRASKPGTSGRDVACLPGERQMPRYHFEIIDGFKLEDPVGLECKNGNQAKQIAEDIARQIAADLGKNYARKIVVVDENGLEIYKALIKA
jgi:hypothetical protein